MTNPPTAAEWLQGVRAAGSVEDIDCLCRPTEFGATRLRRCARSTVQHRPSLARKVHATTGGSAAGTAVAAAATELGDTLLPSLGTSAR